MIPFQGLVFEQQQSEYGKHQKRNDLLRYFQLNEGEGASILLVTDPVGGNHQTVFHESDQPTDEDQSEQAGLLKKLQMLEFEVPVPGKRHKNVRKHQERNGVKSFHVRQVKSG